MAWRLVASMSALLPLPARQKCERIMLRIVRATRYVTPLREGGSLPAIVEADDLGLYVVKFRGAGQGSLALAAELMAGEIGRVLGLNVPEIVFIDIDAALGRNEPDEEVRDLLRASTGLNLALDYLPGSVMFDLAAGDSANPQFASRAVWFDTFVTNVDRTPHNPNLLLWHRALYLIDHGAALYFHHNWQNIDQMATSRFTPIRKHILLPWASEIEAADAAVRPMLTEDVLTKIVGSVPDEWLLPVGSSEKPADRRAAYIEYFFRRLKSASNFVEEALRARAELI
jgi:hypothetical protein